MHTAEMMLFWVFLGGCFVLGGGWDFFFLLNRPALEGHHEKKCIVSIYNHLETIQQQKEVFLFVCFEPLLATAGPHVGHLS